MDYIYSNNIKDLSGSMIREIFNLCKDPSIISFGGGNPSSESFPIAEIKALANKALTEIPIEMLKYGLSDGYIPLRNTLKEHLTNKGMSLEHDHIMVVSGAQQAADLTTKIFVNEGDVVISEDPGFVGCLNTFRSYGAKLVGVPMEKDGMDIKELEKALAENKNVRFIYTIPSFQNPTGFTTSLAKRQEIYRLAQKYNVMIFEDNPYGELRFSGVDIPTIKSMDRDGRVIYAGSFSKVIAPSFRIGYLVYNEALHSKMDVSKQCTDVHSNLLFQYISNEFMTKYDFDAHIAKLCELYKKKAGLMLDEMGKNFHPDIVFERPEGGLFVMAFLPKGYDSILFVKEAINRGIATIPSVAFAVNDKLEGNGFRMNYSSPSDEEIIRGVEILGKLTYEWLKK